MTRRFPALAKVNNHLALSVILIGFSLYAAVSIAASVINSLDSTGGTDLFTYWRINHFTRQADDPYEEFLKNSDIQVPVRYIDGHVATTLPIVDTDAVQALPANSPVMLFLLLPLSFLSWTTAKIVWMLLSIALVLATPWLVFRILASGLSPILLTMMALVFYGMPGTRAAIVTGQTSALTIFLIFLAFWLARNNRKWLGGFALGIALSKFSVAIPLFLFLIYKRNWTALVIGMILQSVAFIGFALLRRGSPLEVFRDFITIAAGHSSNTGIHLTGFLNPTTTISIVIGTAFSIAVFIPLWSQLSNSNVKTPFVELRDYAVFGVLCLWSLLVAYHRGYDIGLALVALSIFLYAASRPFMWGISTRQMQWILPLFLGSLLWMSIPVRFIKDIIGGWWEPFITGAVTLDLLILLIVSLWLLRKVGQIDPNRSGAAK